jgi:hypothetical protein
MEMPPKSSSTTDHPSTLTDFIRSLDGQTFKEWFEEYKHAENIEEGKPYFNNNDYVPDKERHSPSQLLQCHRKLVYRQLNAPRETESSDGIFFMGDVLEELVEEFLVDLGSEHGLFVQNSMYVNLADESVDPLVRFRGETDPIVCGHDGVPVFPTEIKSKSEDAMEFLDSPGTRHRAQAHAYVRGLNERLEALHGDRMLSEFAVIYVARETLEVRVFIEEFDAEFWQSVVEWARKHTQYRQESEEYLAALDDASVPEGTGGVLPPAVPEEPDWECDYCSYSKRCGMDDSIPVENLGASDFLPLTEYSRSAVQAHMEAFPDVLLTPTLAYHHPSLLSDGHPVADWMCRKCGDVPLDRVGWDGDVDAPPTCPDCGECSLRGPLPEQAEVVEVDTDGV